MSPAISEPDQPIPWGHAAAQPRAQPQAGGWLPSQRGGREGLLCRGLRNLQSMCPAVNNKDVGICEVIQTAMDGTATWYRYTDGTCVRVCSRSAGVFIGHCIQLTACQVKRNTNT